MEGSRRNFLNKHSNPQFKRKGVPRNGKQQNYVLEESSRVTETSYRILCPAKKIGSVIGKGGSIVKALREETHAKITVSDSIPGSEERVILISSPSDKRPNSKNVNNGDNAEKGGDSMEPYCVAQDALLRIHDRIVQEDLGDKGDGDDLVVTVRLLVSNNMVGCLLGRKGDVIQRLRSETGANVRVLPADDLPGCATSNDELVQISSNPTIAKKALFEVSTLLHQNPRKDKPTSSFSDSYSSHGLHSSGHSQRNVLPSRNLSWVEHTSDIHGTPPVPWERGYGIHPSAYGPGDFDSPAHPQDHGAPIEFSMKILCSADKIGGVIGKGGMNVRQLEQETGAKIHVDNGSPELDDRIIRVSSYEVIWDQRSQTINAVLQLQNKTSEYSEKGSITTRILVPSSKVGCILGQGGQVINEMRRRTHADIRVFSKDEKPKCASEDEELVQISGSFGVAKDALAEILSRLKARCLRDANARGEPDPVRPVPEFGRAGNLLSFHPSIAIRPGTTGRYEHFKGGFDGYERPSFPAPPHGTGYLSANEAKTNSMPAMGGSRIAEFAGMQLKRHDPYLTDPDIATREHFGDIYRTPSSSIVPSSFPPRGAYQSYSSQHSEYTNIHPSQVPYQNTTPQQVAHNNVYPHPGSYQNVRAHGSYRY